MGVGDVFWMCVHSSACSKVACPCPTSGTESDENIANPPKGVFSCKTFNHISDFERQVARMTNPHRVLPERSKSDRSSSMAFFIGLEKKTVTVATEVNEGIFAMSQRINGCQMQKISTDSMWALSKNSGNPNDLIKDTPKQMINWTCLSKGPHVICMASFWPSSDVESTS